MAPNHGSHCLCGTASLALSNSSPARMACSKPLVSAVAAASPSALICIASSDKSDFTRSFIACPFLVSMGYFWDVSPFRSQLGPHHFSSGLELLECCRRAVAANGVLELWRAQAFLPAAPHRSAKVFGDCRGRHAWGSPNRAAVVARQLGLKVMSPGAGTFGSLVRHVGQVVPQLVARPGAGGGGASVPSGGWVN